MQPEVPTRVPLCGLCCHMLLAPAATLASGAQDRGLKCQQFQRGGNGSLPPPAPCREAQRLGFCKIWQNDRSRAEDTCRSADSVSGSSVLLTEGGRHLCRGPSTQKCRFT